MAALALGLDLGPNSIGWAVIDEEAGRIVRSGVRVFPEGVDRDTSGAEVSKNEQRRMARAIRRQIRRRARRKRQLRHALVTAKLLPEAVLLPVDHPDRVEWERTEFKKADPYSLRRRALSERLEPFEIGRALFHLGQRRGFLSNRKTDRERKKENSVILAEMSELAAEIGDGTLGQHLDRLRGEDPRGFHLTRLRGRHTRRDMYQKEFDRIWAAQQTHHPDLLTDQLKYGSHGKADYPQQPMPRDSNKELVDQFGIYGLLFFQRPILPPSPALVGRCELERRLPRCPRADRRAQRFRLFQEVNNLTCIDISTGEERSFRDPANVDLREKLIRYLRGSKERKFDAIRKHLFDEYENVRFNLERGGRNKIHGMPSDAAIAHKKLLGKAWNKIAERDKDWIVAAIIDDDEARLRQLLEENGIDTHRAPDLLDNVDLESGYSSYSLHAIKKLLPHVERGMPLTSGDADTPCALREAGYLMPWEQAVEQQPFLPQPPDVSNPQSAACNSK